MRFIQNERLTFRTTLGKFLREPAFSELFSSRGLIVGNSNLSAEKGFNADLGFTFSPSPSYQLNVSFFGSWRDELIVLVFDSQGIGRSVNGGKANVFGLEVDNDWSINKQLSLQMNTTIHRRLWFESNYKSEFYYDEANLLPSEGYLLHNVGLEYQWRDFSIGLAANNIGDDNIEDFNGFPRPGRSYYFSFNYRL